MSGPDDDTAVPSPRASTGATDGEGRASAAADSDRPGAGDQPDASTTVDYAWVMQVTFVATIVIGAPIVAVLSARVGLPTWESRVSFAVRVGAVVWILTALVVYLYARRRGSSEP